MFKTQSKPPLARETTTKRRYHERRSEGRNLGKAGAVDPRQGAEAAPGGAGGGSDGASGAVQDAGRLLTRTGNGWLPSASPESTGPSADDQSCRVALCCFAPAHRGHQAVQLVGRRGRCASVRACSCAPSGCTRTESALDSPLAVCGIKAHP